MSAQIDALKAQIANLTLQISQLQDTNSQLSNGTQYLHLLNSELNAENTRLLSLETQLETLVGQLQTLNAQVSSQITQLESQVSQLQSQIAQLKAVIAFLNQTIAPTILNGAGSTFVSPLLTAIDADFTKINPNIQINYQAVGSGAGITDLAQRTVDFAASDAPLTTLQSLTVPNTLTIPDTIGAVVVGYNLPGIASGLRLNVNVTAQIFNGQIGYWNDSKIKALNPGLAAQLPFAPITIVHRSDSSGTTFIFSGYLNGSSYWGLGQSKTINWPAASLGANGNIGVAAVVQGTKYAVGYVELDYALSASPAITYAYLWNPASSSYIQPTLASTAAAASGMTSLPSGDNATGWQSVTLLNSKDPQAYPIVSLSYIMIYKELNVYGSSMTLSEAQSLVNYLWFVVHDGQNQSAVLNYVPLSQNVVTNAEATIRLITYNGQQLHG